MPRLASQMPRNPLVYNSQPRRKAFHDSSRGGLMRQFTQLVATTLGALVIGAILRAQGPAPPPAPWRGAGGTPCVGSDGGIYQCPPAPRTSAVRAGHLFDSKTGTMLVKQVIVIQGERIADVGPEAQVRIPAGAQVIDLSRT